MSRLLIYVLMKNYGDRKFFVHITWESMNSHFDGTYQGRRRGSVKYYSSRYYLLCAVRAARCACALGGDAPAYPYHWSKLITTENSFITALKCAI